IGYLVGSGNTTIVDSESPTTGTLCVLGGAGISNNLHVGEAVYAQGFKCRRGVPATFFGNTFNFYWSSPVVECWIDWSHVGDLAMQDWVQTNFKPLTYEPDLTNYYTKYESNAITSTLAPLDFVYTRAASNQHFKPIEYQPDLTGYYTQSEADALFKPLNCVPDLSAYYTRSQVDTITSTLAPKDSIYSKDEADAHFKPLMWEPDLLNFYTRYERDAITSNLASRDSVYSKFEAGQLFKPLSWQPDLSPYALKTDYMPVPVLFDTFARSENVYSISEADGRFVLNTVLDDLTNAFYTRDLANATFAKSNSVYTMAQSDARYLPITYTPPMDTVYTKTECNDRFPTFQYMEGYVQLYGYSQAASDARYMSITSYQPPDLSPYALSEDVYTKDQSDGRFKPISYEPNLSNYVTLPQADARFMPITYAPAA
ncbi:hypothetical protein HK104_005791, partial [Borealophlyctis nickersoniae]